MECTEVNGFWAYTQTCNSYIANAPFTSDRHNELIRQ